MSGELPLNVEWTNVFKRDYKRAMKRKLDISLLDDIIGKLSRRETLPPKDQDHALHNNWAGFRECHIAPDWLLVYRIFDEKLVFRARRGDIDLNGHVNNVHYVEWLMEGRPASASPCRELDIVFKSETLAGEEVRVESVEVEPEVFIHRVYAPDGRDHVLARTR